MDVDIISTRISECIDDLGLLLDQIYKFPQRQREAYFEKIQTMKNKLLMLKSSLRQGNTYNIEKQYKQIYLTMNSLKNEITLQNNALSIAKQNKQVHNRAKDIKQAKRNYDDAMKLIVQKDEQIRMFKHELFQKEELIKMNFAEINQMKNDFELIIQENRRLKFENTSLQIDLETVKASIDRTSDTAIEYKIREQQKDKVFNSALEELQRLKVELIDANQKINHFEQLAQISMKKTKIVEENIKKVERQAQDLNQNYRMKENNNLRKLREVGQLQFQLGSRGQHIRQLELQNRRLREDIQVLQNQIAKQQKVLVEQRMTANEEKEKLYLEQKKLNADIQSWIIREGQFKRMIEESEKKYLIVIGKLNATQELKVKNKELQIRIESLEQRLKRTENFLQQSKKQNLQLLRQKERLSEQMEMQMRAFREIQIQNFKYREKMKLKDEEKSRIIQELQIYQSKLKESEKAAAYHEVSYQSLEAHINEERNKLVKMEEKHRIKDKQIEGLKIKLLQAKIQTVHEIRETINA